MIRSKRGSELQESRHDVARDSHLSTVEELEFVLPQPSQDVDLCHKRHHMLVWLSLLCLLVLQRASVTEADHGIFRLTHSYAHLEGSSVQRRGQGMSIEHFQRLKAHDRGRMRRLLSIVDFPLAGSDDPLTVGLYYTQVGLGTPMRNYYLQVDTGSDVMWVQCNPCYNCPTSTDLQGIQLTIYDPSASSSSKDVGCSDYDCEASQLNPSCSLEQKCLYELQYGDGSISDGYLVSDVLVYEQLVDGNSTRNASASVFFGCGYNQTGDGLTSSARAVDGIIGFGQAASSVVSQLAAQGKAPHVFTHCLQGENKGGGILVIGAVTQPSLAYTPLVSKQAHYNVNLQNIAVSGSNISSPSVFDISSGGGGTIFDSGTTLAYIVDPAFTNFVDAIKRYAPVSSHIEKDAAGDEQTCFFYGDSVDGSFPEVILYFEGATMQLKPENYLIKEPLGLYPQGYVIHRNIPRSITFVLRLQNSQTAWCIAWYSGGSAGGNDLAYSIFGDIVLKDKLVEYDVANQQIGWVDYDCTQSVSVSQGTGNSSASVDPLSVYTSSSSNPWNARTQGLFLILLCSIVFIGHFH